MSFLYKLIIPLSMCAARLWILLSFLRYYLTAPKGGLFVYLCDTLNILMDFRLCISLYYNRFNVSLFDTVSSLIYIIVIIYINVEFVSLKQ